MDKAAVLAALKKLNKNELNEVINRAKALQANPWATPVTDTLPNGRRAHHSGVSANTGTDPYDYVLAVLVRVSKENGRDHRPIAVLKGLPAYKHFYAAIPDVIKHIESFAPGRANISAVLRMAYYHMTRERNMGAVLLMTHTDTIPLVLSQMFPGYHEAGLMRIVAEKLTRKEA